MARHTLTLPFYEPKGLHWIISKLLSVISSLFLPLLQSLRWGLGEAKMPRVTVSSPSLNPSVGTELKYAVCTLLGGKETWR